MRPDVPGWFSDTIVDGVTFLLSMALPGSPMGDVSALTTIGWIDILWSKPIDWREDADAARLRQAFRALGGDVDRWPAPVQLLRHLPPRPEPPLLPAPRPRVTPQRRSELAQARRRIVDHVTAVNAHSAISRTLAESAPEGGNVGGEG